MVDFGQDLDIDGWLHVIDDTGILFGVHQRVVFAGQDDDGAGGIREGRLVVVGRAEVREQPVGIAQRCELGLVLRKERVGCGVLGGENRRDGLGEGVVLHVTTWSKSQGDLEQANKMARAAQLWGSFEQAGHPWRACTRSRNAHRRMIGAIGQAGFFRPHARG